MRELLRDIAPLLGVILTAIAAVFAYRSAERTRAKDNAGPDNRMAGMVAIGGALASVEGSRLYVEQLQNLVAAIDRLSATQARSTEAWDETRRTTKQMLDHADEIAGSLRDIARLLKERDRH